MNLKEVKHKFPYYPELDLLADDLMQETTSQLIKDFHGKRNKIIADRLKEIAGVDLNIEEEAARRFKSLAIEYNDKEETIYFNDGSITGKRIVTFVRKDNPITYENNGALITVEYSYY